MASLLRTMFLILTLAALDIGSIRSLGAEVDRWAEADISAIQRSLGRRVGSHSGFSPIDMNGDGVVNILDLAAARLGKARLKAPSIGPPAISAGIEQVVVEPIAVTVLQGDQVSLKFIIRNNTTPLLGYSLDIQFVPDTAFGAIIGNPNLSNFFDQRNLITACPQAVCPGGASRDPFFSVIQDNGEGGIFINTITDDNSTILATDGVNDVLAEVIVDIPIGACRNFLVQLGPASALSDQNANAIPFSFSPASITVAQCIPVASSWGIGALVTLLLTAGAILLRDASPTD